MTKVLKWILIITFLVTGLIGASWLFTAEMGSLKYLIGSLMLLFITIPAVNFYSTYLDTKFK